MRKLTLVLLLLLVVLPAISEAAFVPVMVQKAIAGTIKQVLGKDVKKAAEALNNQISENLGRDVSIGDVATMKVEMVQVVEPFGKTSTVTDFLANKAVKLVSILSPLKSSPMKEKLVKSRPDLQVDLNESIGTYVILNESEMEALDALMSAPRCLLTSSDKYFNKVPDPCKALAIEIFGRMTERFDDIQALREKFGPLFKYSSEWDSHWRQVYHRLDQYAQTLLASSSKTRNQLALWNRIGDLVRSTSN